MRKLLLSVLFPVSLFAGIGIEDLKTSAFIEAGQIVKGVQETIDREMDPFSRFGVILDGSKLIEDKLMLKVGVGGIFWRVYPPKPQFYRNAVRFKNFINEASFEYFFTENLTIKAGYFDIKYNTQADNLGEYLFRSEAYPSYVNSGILSFVDSAYSRNNAVMFSWDLWDGKFNQKMMFVSEMTNPPFFDVSPAYLFSLSPINGLTLGGGVSLHRWLSVDNEKTSPDHVNLQYRGISNFPEVQNIAKVSIDNGTGGRDTVAVFWNANQNISQSKVLGDSGTPHQGLLLLEIMQTGSAAGQREGYLNQLGNLRSCKGDESGSASRAFGRCVQLMNDGDTLLNVVNGIDNGPLNPVFNDEKDLSFKAVKLMAHFNLDFNSLFGLDVETIGPFGLFGEVAVLGLENFPIYYEKTSDRTPKMFGVKIPTFGLFDQLSFQIESWSNPNLSNLDFITVDQGFPYPVEIESGELKDKPEIVDGDDLKWSVRLERKIISGIKMKAQVASDHLRLFNDLESEFINEKMILNRPSQWYYMLRVEWGI